MEKIVFLDRSTLEAEVRRPVFSHAWVEYPVTAPGEIVERLRDATIAITNKAPLRAEALARLPSLKLIAEAATGVNNIDMDWCREHGIAVCNIRDYAVHSVAEHVFMMILALRRNLVAYRQDLQQGLWQRSSRFCLFTHPIRDIHGSTLGIVGHGALGQAVAQVARGFGMTVWFAEHQGAARIRPGFEPFERVLRESDVLTVHVPLTDATRDLIDAAELRLMKPDALLINTARGGVVNETALAAALEQNVIGGAGFDVLSVEPPTGGNPLLTLSQSNFLLTPHIAWASREAMQTLADQLIANIEAFVRGAPQNLVD
jgi:glycerate dehydrogenase